MKIVLSLLFIMITTSSVALEEDATGEEGFFTAHTKLFLSKIQELKQHLIYDDDPLETLNREIFRFNTTLDKNILIPLASSYKENVPAPMQSGVSNFFNNLGEVPTFANQLLQFKFTDSFDTAFRFLLNSTLGLGGIVDVASDMGITYREENFGQTLGHYGVSQGPYLMLPILGPSTVRDSVGRVADSYAQLDLGLEYPTLTKNALSAIPDRAEILDLSTILYNSEDPYTKLRSSYLQQQKYLVNDGITNINTIDF